jgi:thiamine-monophosphate kinase
LFGGDTTGGDQLVVSVTVWGEPAGERLLRRSQAEVGDLLVVTGRLGGSFASGRHLCPTPRLAEGAWLGSRDFVHGLMDLSDGLAADAPKLAEASSCGCLLLPGDLPLHADVDLDGDPFGQALCDGEDYELLMAVAAEHWPALQMAWPFDCELTRVGWLLAEPGSFIENQIGRIVPSPYEGFVHRA